MPSGAKKRKAKAKKKQVGEAQAHNQQHGNKEDSGNEHELENEHEHDHEEGQDHAHEEDPITPKTPVQTNEAEEKEKVEVEGGSSDAEEAGSLDRGFNQNQENHTLTTSFQQVESSDINLGIPQNGGGGLENEVEISSGGASEDKDGPIENVGPLTSTEGQPQAAPARTLSSSSSSNHVRDNGDEIHHDEKEAITDVVVVALGDEREVSSSTLVVSEENEANQSLGPSTNENETLHAPKDDGEAHVDIDDPSEELESSDGDESKLDVVSTMATLDANESIQSVDSVDSPRSVHSQQYSDQIYNERAELASQDQDRGSEGFSETPFQEIGSKVDFLNAESGDKPSYKVGMEFVQEGDCHGNSLSEESSKCLNNENIPVSTEVVIEENIPVSTEVVMEFVQEGDCHENSLYKESSKGLSNEDNIPVSSEVVNEENIPVSTEVVSDNYAVALEELPQAVADLEKIEVASSVSLATANEESEAIPKAEENDAKESVMPLPVSESLNTRHVSVISTSGEAGEKVVLTGEAIGDVISTAGQPNQDVVSAGGAVKDGMGLIKVQGTSANPNEISDKEIASRPRNGTNEKKINLPQRESRTSWLHCCGIIDLFTASRS